MAVGFPRVQVITAVLSKLRKMMGCASFRNNYVSLSFKLLDCQYGVCYGEDFPYGELDSNYKGVWIRNFYFR